MLLLSWCFLPFWHTESSTPVNTITSRAEPRASLPLFEYRNGFLIYRYISPTPKAPIELLKEAIAAALTFKLSKEVATSSGSLKLFLSSSGKIISSTYVRKARPLFQKAGSRGLTGWELWLAEGKSPRQITLFYPIQSIKTGTEILRETLQALYIMNLGKGMAAESTGSTSQETLSIVHLSTKATVSIKELSWSFEEGMLKIKATMLYLPGDSKESSKPKNLKELEEQMRKLKMKPSKTRKTIELLNGSQARTICLRTEHPDRFPLPPCHAGFLAWLSRYRKASVEINFAVALKISRSQQGSPRGTFSIDRTKITPHGSLSQRTKALSAAFFKLEVPPESQSTMELYIEEILWQI